MLQMLDKNKIMKVNKATRTSDNIKKLLFFVVSYLFLSFQLMAIIRIDLGRWPLSYAQMRPDIYCSEQLGIIYSDNVVLPRSIERVSIDERAQRQVLRFHNFFMMSDLHSANYVTNDAIVRTVPLKWRLMVFTPDRLSEADRTIYRDTGNIVTISRERAATIGFSARTLDLTVTHRGSSRTPLLRRSRDDDCCTLL